MSNGSESVQHTSLMTMASRRSTHKDGCEGIKGGRAGYGKPMSHYLRFIRCIAVGPSSNLQMKETNLYGEGIFLLVPC